MGMLVLICRVIGVGLSLLFQIVIRNPKVNTIGSRAPIRHHQAMLTMVRGSQETNGNARNNWPSIWRWTIFTYSKRN